MTPGLITIDTEFSRQVGVQEQAIVERTVDGIMTHGAILIIRPDESVNSTVEMLGRGYMTLPTESFPRLGQQAIIFAAMRSMAFDTTGAFDNICIDSFMFVKERAALFRVTITTERPELKGQAVILFDDEAMTAKTIHFSLQNRVVGDPAKGVFLFLVAIEAEGSPFGKQQ